MIKYSYNYPGYKIVHGEFDCDICFEDPCVCPCKKGPDGEHFFGPDDICIYCEE